MWSRRYQLALVVLLLGGLALGTEWNTMRAAAKVPMKAAAKPPMRGKPPMAVAPVKAVVPKKAVAGKPVGNKAAAGVVAKRAAVARPPALPGPLLPLPGGLPMGPPAAKPHRRGAGAAAHGIMDALGLPPPIAGGAPPPAFPPPMPGAMGMGAPPGPGGLLAAALGIGAPPPPAKAGAGVMLPFFPPAVAPTSAPAWLHGNTIGALQSLETSLPTTVEFAVRDVTSGAALGTAMVSLRCVRGRDAHGIMFECAFLGASEAELANTLADAFSTRGAMLHLCAGAVTTCPYIRAGAAGCLVHSDTFRGRTALDLLEPWAAAAKAMTGPPTAAHAGLGGRGALGLPSPSGPALPLLPPAVGPPSTAAPSCGPAVEINDQMRALQEKLKKLQGKFKRRDVGEALSERAGKRRRKGDSDSEENADFRLAPGREDDLMGGRIQGVAESDPGHWFITGVRQMMQRLAIRSGAENESTSAADMQPCAVTFLTSVYHGSHPPNEVGIRTTRELRTWCEAVDCLIKGDLPHLGDVCMQRIKALMLAHNDGNWNAAKFLELIPNSDVQLVTTGEQRSMIRERVTEQRLSGKAPPGPSPF